MGFAWSDFFTLTPYAAARIVSARRARVHDDIVKGAYQAEAFSRTKRMKPLKAYQSTKKQKSDGNEQARMLAALGITPEEIEEARQETMRRRETGALQSDDAG